MRSPDTHPAEAKATPQRARNLRPLAMLVPYALRYPGRLMGALCGLVLAAGATLAIPLAVRRMIDNGFDSTRSGLIDQYFTVLIIIVAVLAAASSLRYYFVITLGERVVADIRRDLFAHLTRLSIAFFDSARSGEIASRLSADTTQIKSTVGASASIALRNGIMFIGAAVLMTLTAPSLAAFVLAAIPVIVIPLIVFGRKVQRSSRRAQDLLADAAGYASEQIAAMRTLQAFTHEQAARDSFTTYSEGAYQAARQSTAARAALTAIAIFLVFSSVVMVLWFGASDVIAGRLSAGTLSQFVLYAMLAAGALGEVSQVWAEIAQGAGAAERISELLREDITVKTPVPALALPTPARGEIVFDNVIFAYPTRPDHAVFDNLSFAVRPGERIAIVGPSGAGKSTILSLLLRAYDPQQGRVLVDGIDISKADPQAVRGRMAIVQQDPTVFADTVANNIRYGKEAARDEDIASAARSAHALDFIRMLPRALETAIGERGVTLSGGQRQRVAIARAILRDAPILLLDEATSALDAESERLVQDALDRLMIGRTTLVIAHRLATVLKADRILVIDQGRIVEEGKHEELVRAGGLYGELARLQFADIQTRN